MRYLFDDNYSFFVTWAKTLLPIFALGMLSTIFLFSGKVDVTKSLPYAELNVAEIIREQRITKPYFTGTSETGFEFALSAAHATPGTNDSGILNISELSVEFKSPQNKIAKITAGLGTLNSNTKFATVSKGVRLEINTSFWVTADELNISFRDSHASTKGPFTGVSTIGSLESGKMMLRLIDNEQQILFTDGVRMLYQPKIN